MINRTSLWRWIYTTGGIGLLPGAPGTYASIACVVFWYFLPTFSIQEVATTFILIAVLGIISSEKAIREIGASDPSCVVIDEWLGQGVALVTVPHTLFGGVLALAFFRIFDILKPPPVRWLEKVPGGAGVMLDDLGAGVMAALLLRFIFYFLPAR